METHIDIVRMQWTVIVTRKECYIGRMTLMKEAEGIMCVNIYIIIYTYIPYYSIHHLYLTNLLMPIIYVTFSGSLLFLHTCVCSLKTMYEVNKFIV